MPSTFYGNCRFVVRRTPSARVWVNAEFQTQLGSTRLSHNDIDLNIVKHPFRIIHSRLNGAPGNISVIQIVSIDARCDIQSRSTKIWNTNIWNIWTTTDRRPSSIFVFTVNSTNYIIFLTSFLLHFCSHNFGHQYRHTG